jgi:hypothetical protein
MYLYICICTHVYIFLYRGKYLGAWGQGSIASSTHGLGASTHGFSSAAPSTQGLSVSTHGLGASTHGLGASTHGFGGFMGFREGGREGSVCTDMDKRDDRLRVDESYVQLLYVPLFATLEDNLGGWNVLVIYCRAVLLYLYPLLFVC